jgi:hypothetical protein
MIVSEVSIVSGPLEGGVSEPAAFIRTRRTAAAATCWDRAEERLVTCSFCEP